MSFEELLDVTEALANSIAEWNHVTQIIYDGEPDAMIATALLARVLFDLDHPCVLTQYSNEAVGTIENRNNHLTVFIGLDDIQLSNFSLSKYEKGLILTRAGTVLSTFIPEFFEQVDAGNYGYTYSDASLSSLMYFICSPIAPSLEYIVQLPLVAIESYRPMEEYTGLHQFIKEDAEAGEVVHSDKRVAFLGMNYFSISESIQYTLNPFLPGLTGDNHRINELLTKKNVIAETTEGKRKLADLSDEEVVELNSAIVIHLNTQKNYKEENLRLIKPYMELINESETSILRNTRDFSQAIIDAARRTKTNTAMAVLLGNRTDHFRAITRLYTEERRAVSISYNIIKEHSDDVIDLSMLRYYISSDKINWYNASVTAAMGLSHGLVFADKPFAVVAPGPGPNFTIGIRASKSHSIGSGIVKLAEKILTERDLMSDIEGSLLSAQFSVEKDVVESILLDINAELMELINP